MSAASAATPPVVVGQRVFVAGHSFHIFVADRLPALVASAGIEGHELAGKQMIGGSSVTQHWNLPDAENVAKAKLTAGAVDVLTLSPNWVVPDQAVESFVKLGLEHNPRLRILVQISWPAFDHCEPIVDANQWVHRDKMIQSNEERDTRSLDGARAATASVKQIVEKQVAEINRNIGSDVVHIVPVSDAVLRLREEIIAGKVPGITRQSELFTDAIGHGKAPIEALATYCNFASIYQRTPVGLEDGDAELDRIHPKLRHYLQSLAWETVAHHPLSRLQGNQTLLKN